ncbi:MAG: hypothetical protein Q4D52_06430 [Eubacteriales bacterium]|nr:hypothetical protein [Eubacteriales bacterium]
MNLLIGIVLTVLLYTGLSKMIKRHAVAAYLLVYAGVTTVVIAQNMGWLRSMPQWVITVSEYFSRGILTTATFVVVMYLGVFAKQNAVTKRLFPIRGELSIIGSLLTITHNVIFGIHYFPQLFLRPQTMPLRTLAAAGVSVLLLLLLIPLFITSFKCIRKKMKAAKWKRLQRLAYPFFMLIYVHVMILYTADPEKHLVDCLIYSVVFIGYAILRLRRQWLKQRKG